MGNDNINKGRRKFLKLGVLAGAGLALGAYVTLDGEQVKTVSQLWQDEPHTLSPNPWLSVAEDGTVTVRVNHTEMGQGIATAFGMIVAEEMEADWKKVSAETAPAESLYKNPAYNTQMTAGSTSICTSWDILRKAGATARIMLTTAAARTWNVPENTCRAEMGRIYHLPTGRSLDYGALASKAAKVQVPEDPPLKDPRNYRIIGKNVQRLEGREKAEGRAIFGMDLRLPDMVRAYVLHAPVLGGKPIHVDDRETLKKSGVIRVVNLDTAVAVVGNTAWEAMEGADALKVTWDRRASPAMDTEALKKRWPALIRESGKTVVKKGDPEKIPTGSGRVVKGAYFVPYQAHAAPEPMNCTARLKKGHCDVWAPTQHQGAAQEAAARITGLGYEDISIHTPFVGGGFGRRVAVDYVKEAVTLAKILRSPVQVFWSREEDMKNDCYRPATYNELEASLDHKGIPLSWTHRIVGSDHMTYMFPKLIPSMLPYALPRELRDMVSSLAGSLLPRFMVGKNAAKGAAPLPYSMEHVKVNFVQDDPGIPTGFWRSVSHSQNAFLVESFMDEIAAATGRDPVEMRFRLIKENPRFQKVLELAVEKSGWGKPLNPNIYQGIAIHNFHNTLLAFVAEVSVSKAGEVRVHRVVCALDCGVAIHPKNIAAQMRGGIAFGLTATLKGSINIDKGRVRESNFDDFPILRMNEMPHVDVHILPSTNPPTGIGEAAVPLIAPAVCNAVFAATNVRIRRLPVDSTLLAS
jgi:isoquinoline 1-oxidoreductase subunit beta